MLNMKITFYIYWAWYIIATLFIVNMDLTPFSAKLFVCVHHVSFILIVVVPMAHLVIMQEKLDRVNWKYIEGCMLSFILRGFVFIMNVWGLKNNYNILALCGMVMTLWYVFNIDKLFKKV